MGCKVVFSDANTLNVEKCLMAITSNFVETSSNTSVTWGCTGCSAQASSTKFYLYADETSTGSTLVLVISTTAPSSNGFNGNDRVLAKFYNNSAGDIDTYSIDQFHVNEFRAQKTGYINGGAITFEGTTTDPTIATTTTANNIIWKREGPNIVAHYKYSATTLTGALPGSGDYMMTLPNSLRFGGDISFYATVEGSGLFTIQDSQVIGNGSFNDATYVTLGIVVPYDITRFRFLGNYNAGGGCWGAAYAPMQTIRHWIVMINAPIEGWE
jgi:hypothetical protein